MTFAPSSRHFTEDGASSGVFPESGAGPSAPVAVLTEDLCFTFPGRTSPSLSHISLTIRQGECVVVTGPSGCGKSTLALALAGYIPQVIEGRISGKIEIGGIDAAKTALCDLASRVSLCQQDPESQLCTLNVTDEICFGPENLNLPLPEVLRRKDQALAAIGSSHLDGRDVRELSGGETQRVAIASMLAMSPELLILDEPTSNLDPDAASEVLRAIERLRRNKKLTLIVIEHRLNRLLGLADRLVVMEDGRIAEDGDPAEIHPRYLASLNRRDQKPARPARDANAPPGPIVLQASGIGVSLGARKVLDNVSFSSRSGEITGIIGANGSGKTTFLRCLASLIRPDEGSVSLFGEDIGQMKTSILARRLGFVFQNPNHQIFAGSVADEVAFSCRNFGFDKDLTDRLTDEALTDYDLAGYRASHPWSLSHGEKRRLTLCSVLPHGPDIVFLDEPFIGQDEANTARMIAALLRLKAKRRTVLIVSHDMTLVYGYCDRVVLFEKGRIAVDDTPDRARERIALLGRTNFLPEAP